MRFVLTQKPKEYVHVRCITKLPTVFSLQSEKQSGPRAANRVLQNDTGYVNGSGKAPSDRVVMIQLNVHQFYNDWAASVM